MMVVEMMMFLMMRSMVKMERWTEWASVVIRETLLSEKQVSAKWELPHFFPFFIVERLPKSKHN